MAARALGAEVAGLDASSSLAEIARERLPGARIEVGEMEDLPFGDQSFDIVTGFNSFQFAGDPARALRAAQRVCRAGGRVLVLVWGRREDCDLLTSTLPAVLELLPQTAPGRPSAPGPTALSDRARLQALLREASLRPVASGEIDCEFRYPDAETALRAFGSAAPLVRAVRHAGEDAVRRSVLATLRPFERPDGSVVQRNRFRWMLAERD
jgi:SAM-dependent methyltransferase